MNARPDAARSRPAAKERGSGLLLAFSIGAWVAVFCALTLHKLREYLYADFDLAIFAQAMARLGHGQWFSSIRGMNWLGDHSSLILVPLAPLLAPFPRPAALLVVQCLALGLGAWPVFLLARQRSGRGRLALAWAWVWLLQPALAYLALFEFHPEALATLLLAGAGAALALGRPRIGVALAACALLAKEDVAFAVAGLALAHLRSRRREGWRVSALLAGLSVAALLVTFAWLKPHFAAGEAAYGDMYAGWGTTPAEILRAVLSRPLDAFAALFSTPGNAGDSLAKQQYWLQLLAPSLALALLAPRWLLPALPIWLEHFLSFRTQQHTILYQYTALVLPWVILGAVEGTGRGARRLKAGGASTALAVLALLASLAGQLAFGPFAAASRRRAPEPWWPSALEHRQAVARRVLLARVPAAGTVVADFASLTPLSARDSLHSLHHIARGRYTFSERSYPAPANAGAMIADLAHSSTIGYLDLAGSRRLAAWLARERLRVCEASGDLVLCLRRERDTLEWLRPEAPPAGSVPVAFAEGFAWCGGRLADPSAQPWPTLEVDLWWRRDTAVTVPVLSRFVISAPDGRVVYDQARLVGRGLSVLADWPAGVPYLERFPLPLPVGLVPGRYRVTMAVGVRRDRMTFPAESSDPRWRASRGLTSLGTFEWPPRSSP